MAEKSICFLIVTLELNVMHPQGVDVVLAASVAGLQVEKFGIRITFGEKSDAGSLSSNGSLQRGQTERAQLSFSSQGKLMRGKRAPILSTVEPVNNFFCNGQLQPDQPDMLGAPGFESLSCGSQFYVQHPERIQVGAR